MIVSPIILSSKFIKGQLSVISVDGCIYKLIYFIEDDCV